MPTVAESHAMAARPERTSWHMWWMVFLAYLVVAVVMMSPFTNGDAFGSSSYGGDQRLIIWTLAWDNHAVLAGLPLFDSNLFFPANGSLRYNEHLFGVSLFTLPWSALGFDAVWAHNITLWLGLLANALATFALLRRYTGAALPAFVGSLPFLWSFYVMLHVHAHLHLVWLWPLPLSMLLLERWFDRPTVARVGTWLAVALVGVLTSWYIAVMTAFVTAAMLVSLLATARSTPASTKGAPTTARRRVITLVGAFAVLVAVVLPFARPYMGLRSAPREAAAFAATVSSYVVPPENTLVGSWWKAHLGPAPGSIWGEQTVFAGWIALVLAAIGLVSLVRGGRAQRPAWVFASLAVGGFLLSLGPSPALTGGSALAPYAWLSVLPGFEGMRAPARFAVVAMLGCSGLAALGITSLTGRGWFRRVGVAAVLVAAMLAEWFVVDFPAGLPAPHDVPEVYRTPELQSARALVSIPDYSDTPEWFRGADYLYYSMAHWRPIINGFGRARPDGYDRVLATVRGFPSTAPDLRELGVQYVVVHADRLPSADRGLVDAARASSACRLVSQHGNDFLFELLDR